MRKLFFYVFLCLMTQLSLSNQVFSQSFDICAKYHCTDIGLWNVHFDLTLQSTDPALPTLTASAISDSSGCVSLFNGVPSAGYTPSLNIYKDGDPLEGVNTLDLIQIHKHILGIQPLNSPYKMIAADANNSGSITAFDILELRNLIMGIYTQLPNNNVWSFVDSTFVFPNPANPFQEVVPVAPLEPGVHKSFYGIKIGDVDCSALQFFQAPDEEYLTIPDLYLQANEVVEVPVSLSQIASFAGFQFGLQFDPAQIELLNVLPGFIAAQHYASFSDRVNVSWDNVYNAPIPNNQPIYRLRIKALVPVHLADIFSLIPTGIHAEAYRKNDDLVDLRLQFGTVATGEPNTAQTIFEPTPNPTTTGVRIPLQLESSEKVLVEILDVTGRLLYQQQQNKSMGAQSLEIPATAFPQKGVYTWRVQVGSQFRSGKIVKQ